MKIETRYNYEKVWQETHEQDLVKIIQQEVGDVGVEGTLVYIKEVVKLGKEISVGSCKFRLKK